MCVCVWLVWRDCDVSLGRITLRHLHPGNQVKELNVALVNGKKWTREQAHAEEYKFLKQKQNQKQKTSPCQSFSLTSYSGCWNLFANTVIAHWSYMIRDTASKKQILFFGWSARAHCIWEKLLIIFRLSNLWAVEINYCHCSVAGLNPDVLSEGKSSLYAILYGFWGTDIE